MIKCERCGKTIDRVVTWMFNYGDDYEKEVPIEEHENAVTFDVDANWCGYDLLEWGQRERIKCPYCLKFPFKCDEIQNYDFVRVIMFKEGAEE